MFNIRKIKIGKVLIFSIALIAFILFLANAQLKVMEVSAQVIAVTVQGDNLHFGTVFPGEELEGSLTISYIETQGQIDYRVVQKRKPLAPEHPEYPDGGDPEMPGYYRNLCLFLTKVNMEGEGDTEEESSVGESDLSDEWIIYFKVPAIVGHIAQEHINGVVTSNGEYGCDISIEVIEP